MRQFRCEKYKRCALARIMCKPFGNFLSGDGGAVGIVCALARDVFVVLICVSDLGLGTIVSGRIQIESKDLFITAYRRLRGRRGGGEGL